MEDDRARELYIRMQVIQKHLGQLDAHVAELEEKLGELARMRAAVEQAQEFTDEELMVPLTNGIFLPARTSKPEKLYLNVGAGTVVERTPQQAITMLKDQEEELHAYRQKLEQERASLVAEAERIGEQVENSDV